MSLQIKTYLYSDYDYDYYVASRVEENDIFSDVASVKKLKENNLSEYYKFALSTALQAGYANVAIQLDDDQTNSDSYNLSLAVRAISDFLFEHEMDVTLITPFDSYVYKENPNPAFEITKQPVTPLMNHSNNSQPEYGGGISFNYYIAPRKASVTLVDEDEMYDESVLPVPEVEYNFLDNTIEEFINKREKSFSKAVLDKIDELGLTDSDVYKHANVNRKVFSKLRIDNNYQPSKQTALALSIALKLDYEEIQDLLNKAGYSLSNSNIGDRIIEYYVKHNNYDIYAINEELFKYNQKQLF